MSIKPPLWLVLILIILGMLILGIIMSSRMEAKSNIINNELTTKANVHFVISQDSTIVNLMNSQFDTICKLQIKILEGQKEIFEKVIHP
jgi:hypothetical protein